AAGVISMTVRSGHASARSAPSHAGGPISDKPIAVVWMQARNARSRNHATLVILLSLWFLPTRPSRRLAPPVARARVGLVAFHQPDQKFDELRLLIGGERRHDLRMRRLEP